MPVLAQYGIRFKQDYIFRTNAMKEMMGASHLIRDAFDVLLDAAHKEAGLTVQDCGKAFDMDDVLKRFAGNTLDMAELYRGGGNCLVLFAGEEACRTANAAFTYKLACDFPGLIPLCVGIPVGADGKYDYSADYGRLMAAVSDEKDRMAGRESVSLLPFTEIDRKTCQPIVDVQTVGKEIKYYSAEEKAKRRKAEQDGQQEDMDDLIHEKGIESLLAVIHADGNNMGKKIRSLLKDASDYTFCVNSMRDFAGGTQQIFSVQGRKAVDAEAAALANKIGRDVKVRWLICDGDDATFVCNARYARELTAAYLNAVAGNEGYSSCAGICIFHSRYPFYMAYQYAEQCCDSAKKKIHLPGRVVDEGWIDMHYLHAGLGGSLEEARQAQGTVDRMARPLLVTGNGAQMNSLHTLDVLAGALDRAGVTRTNIKTVGAAWENAKENGRQELHRVFFRAPGLQEKLSAISGNEDDLLKLIYDLSEVYDLWYSWKLGGNAT